MSERARIFVLDLLESYAREQGIGVRLERTHHRDEWTCALSANGTGEAVSASGRSAREAILSALERSGVELPG